MNRTPRSLIASFAHETWSGEGGFAGALARIGLRPFETMYRLGVSARNAAYDRRLVAVVTPEVPVVSVGNVLVGGTGKTPVAAWIARLLQGEGRAPALVSRGYGADELRLHRLWSPDIPIVADPDRARAVHDAAERGRRSVVLDDGFQHRRLARTLDLVLHPLEGPWDPVVLPRGPFREPAGSLGRADRIVLTRRTPPPSPPSGPVSTGDAERSAFRQDALASAGGSESGRPDDRREPSAPEGEDPRWSRAEAWLRAWAPGVPVTRMSLDPDAWRAPNGRVLAAPEGPLLAVTGIARPDLFVQSVRARTGEEVHALTFPDHHEFSAGDVRRIRAEAAGRTIVTTEKDAVRWKEVGGDVDVAILTLRVADAEGSPERSTLDALRRDVLRATRAADSGSPGSREPGRTIASSEDVAGT